MVNKSKLLIVFILLAFVCGCGAMGVDGDLKSWGEMGSKEKATFLMSVYNKQYDAYMQLYAKEDRTEADNQFLRDKKSALEAVYPYIDTYAQFAESGTIPPAAVEQAAIEAVGKLLNM